MSAVLRAQGLTKDFDGLVVNAAIDLELPQGARHALIGPNGAGKTTLINLLSGALAPSKGEVFLCGERVTNLAPHQRAQRGLVRTFQINRLFPGLSVLETALLAICARKGLLHVWRRLVTDQHEELSEAHELLAGLLLAGDERRAIRELSYGKQRLLEIALALAARPKVLLLDEPAAGIPTAESAGLFEVLARLPADVSILLIEHDMDLVFRFAERVTVLAGGRVLTEGSPAEIVADARVREVYLGEASHD